MSVPRPSSSTRRANAGLAGAHASANARLGQTGRTLHFNFQPAQLDELMALRDRFRMLRRLSWSEQIDSILARVRCAIDCDGDVRPDFFTFTDFGVLMGKSAFAGEISAECREACRDVARAIWCGLTGDPTCPIVRVEGR